MVASSLRYGLYLPPFNEMSDPAAVVEMAVLAEASGFDGFFLWDHVLRQPEQAPEVADPWILLAAVATATSRIRLGTMVTPLVRRRPQVLARQVVTLDHLSGGRVTLGLGLGVDTTGELSLFGELVDPVQRGDLLDEGVALIAEMMTGEEVKHRGRYFVVDGARFLPTPLQRPRVPIWLGARATSPGGRALRRAALYDGLFLIEADESSLERSLALVRSERGSLDGFDVAVIGHECNLPPDVLGELGVTWAMTATRPHHTRAEIERLVRAGPPSTER